jgi:hypothetical protein
VSPYIESIFLNDRWQFIQLLERFLHPLRHNVSKLRIREAFLCDESMISS